MLVHTPGTQGRDSLDAKVGGTHTPDPHLGPKTWDRVSCTFVPALRKTDRVEFPALALSVIFSHSCLAFDSDHETAKTAKVDKKRQR